jgi:CRP-like cAMP-binding protein
MLEKTISRPTNHLLAALPDRVTLTLRLNRHLLNKDQVLFDIGEPITKVWFPLEAVVSLLIPLSSGQTVETAMVGRDGVIGALAAFGAKHATSRALVQLSGECLCCEIETLTSAIANYPELRSIIISHEQALLAHVQQSAACNATHNLESRLARRLLRAVDLHSRQELSLTQEYLAQMLGARRTTVTLIAKSFQDDGMIKYKRGRIVVCDAVKLQNVACECYQAVKSNYAALRRGNCWEDLPNTNLAERNFQENDRLLALP